MHLMNLMFAADPAKAALDLGDSLSTLDDRDLDERLATS